MEDLRRAFENNSPGRDLEAEPANATMTQTTRSKRPPPTPDEDLVQAPGSIQLDEMRQQYSSPDNSMIDRRHTDERMTSGHDHTARQHGKQQQLQSKVRLSVSKDDMDIKHGTGERFTQAPDLRLYRQLEKLSERAKAETARANEAEAREAALEYEFKSRYEELVKECQNVQDTATRHRREAKRLKDELEDARTQIFALQPYRKDLTPEEVGRDYDELVTSVSNWVEKFMTPVLDSDECCEYIATLARKWPPELSRLRKFMQAHGDLVHGCMYPETDIDVAIAIVMRYLFDNIFNKVLYEAAPRFIEWINFTEASMQTNVEPKRDLFTIRSWTAEAYNALLCSPDFRNARQERMKTLTISLAEIFKPIVRHVEWRDLCYGFQDECIKPSMKLHEKMMISTHHYYLDVSPYINWNKGTLETSSEFLDELQNLDCENVLHARKKFVLAKLDPKPTRRNLEEHLKNLVTLVPSLNMRQIARGDSITEPTVVRKQQMLVAWGPPGKMDEFVSSSGRTLMHAIFFTEPVKKKSDSNDSTWQTAWKWP